MSKRSKEIIEQLSLREKCELCAQADGSFGKVERLGLSGVKPQDNPRGGEDYFRSGRPAEGDGKYHPVAFPSDSCLAMSWDEDLAYKTGKFFAEESRANPELINWLFRPGVNIKRSPLCGRNFEYFSEDPLLSGEMAGAYINGLQDNGVAATLKHYICNNHEFERMTTNAVVSERALREIYLRAFEIAIRKGNPSAIMSSYNQVNGEWVNSNGHICELLRKDLGYEGVVVSDFAAIHRNKVKSHSHGMVDIELAPSEIHSEELFRAVEDGRVPETVIDASLERIFDLVDKLYETKAINVDMNSLHEEARKAAEECIVLLKNDGILPLNKTQQNVLIAGALAEDPSYMGGGSGHMNGYRVDTYVDRIREVIPNAEYVPGYILEPGIPPAEPVSPELISQAENAAKRSDIVVAVAGLGYCYESEGFDRPDIRLPEGQRLFLDALIRTGKPVILILSGSSVLDITPWESRLAAVVYNNLGGEAVASSTVNVLFGDAEPGGRLAESWPLHEEHTPSYINFPHECTDQQDVIYGEGIYVGYRWYEKRKLPVLYPFGHGLSYTSFEIGQPVLSSNEITPDEVITISASVRNTGKRPGSQVVQLYVSHDTDSICDHPEKELKSFAKVFLQPGEEKMVSLTLDRKAFEFFAPGQNKWIVEDGGYSIHIGTSCQDIHHVRHIMINGGDMPFVYTEMTPLVWFIRSEKYMNILREEFPPEISMMMDQSAFEWCVLLLPLPFYKVTEPFLGRSIMTEEQMHYILRRMNE